MCVTNARHEHCCGTFHSTLVITSPIGVFDYVLYVSLSLLIYVLLNVWSGFPVCGALAIVFHPNLQRSPHCPYTIRNDTQCDTYLYCYIRLIPRLCSKAEIARLSDCALAFVMHTQRQIGSSYAPGSLDASRLRCELLQRAGRVVRMEPDESAARCFRSALQQRAAEACGRSLTFPTAMCNRDRCVSNAGSWQSEPTTIGIIAS